MGRAKNVLVFTHGSHSAFNQSMIKKAPFCYLKQGGVFYGNVPGLSPEHIAICEIVIIDAEITSVCLVIEV